LNEYFAGVRRTFTLPLAARGTPFQRAVWAALCEIPCGETRTYGQIAAAIGKPNATRAVGAACHANPIAILIPCHRVLGASGALTGYAAGVEVKEYLLALEQG
jgi:methylated-DNA-[protein]-cysteine S-methyltransferase